MDAHKLLSVLWRRFSQTRRCTCSRWRDISFSWAISRKILFICFFRFLAKKEHINTLFPSRKVSDLCDFFSSAPDSNVPSSLISEDVSSSFFSEDTPDSILENDTFFRISKCMVIITNFYLPWNFMIFISFIPWKKFCQKIIQNEMITFYQKSKSFRNFENFFYEKQDYDHD